MWLFQRKFLDCNLKWLNTNWNTKSKQKLSKVILVFFYFKLKNIYDLEINERKMWKGKIVNLCIITLCMPFPNPNMSSLVFVISNI